jgi:hypothetical protein
MPWIALMIGVVIVLAYHLTKPVENEEGVSHRQRFLPWLLRGGAMAALFLLFRVGGWGMFYRLQALLITAWPWIRPWLQRENFRRASRMPPAAAAGKMSQEEARHILGVAEQASEEEIKSAYKKLMLAVHPDKGGNSYLAGKLNEAREVLLSK